MTPREIDVYFETAADAHNHTFGATIKTSVSPNIAPATAESEREKFERVLWAIEHGQAIPGCLGLARAGLVKLGRDVSLGLFEAELTDPGRAVRDALRKAQIMRFQR